MKKFLEYESVKGFVKRHNLTISYVENSEIVFSGAVPETRCGEAIFSEDFAWQTQAIFRIENLPDGKVVLRLIA